MENSILVGTSHQGALRRSLEAIATNIANMNTPGFKRESMMFVDHLVKTDGPRRPEDDVFFVRDVATYRDFSLGEREATGNPLDFALGEDGFFTVQDGTGTAYTRNGRFSLDQSGQIVNGEGKPLLDRNGQPLVVPNGEGPISVAADGTVSSPNSVIGQIGVVRFDNPHQLTPIGASLFVSDAQAQPVDRPVVVQGMLERSNVQGVVELDKMIRVSRAYDSIRKVVEREDERMGKMVQIYAG